MGKLKVVVELFEGRHFDREVIILCVRAPASSIQAQSARPGGDDGRARPIDGACDVHVLAAALPPEFEKRWRQFARVGGEASRVGETCVTLRGEWRYLYGAVDRAGRAVRVSCAPGSGHPLEHEVPGGGLHGAAAPGRHDQRGPVAACSAAWSGMHRADRRLRLECRSTAGRYAQTAAAAAISAGGLSSLNVPDVVHSALSCSDPLHFITNYLTEAALGRASPILRNVASGGGRSDRGLTERDKHRGERCRRCVRPLPPEDRKLEIR